MAKKESVTNTKKASTGRKPKLTDAEMVSQYLDEFKGTYKKEMEAVRKIILGSNKKIAERIKWKAPSYYYKDDIVTFNAWATENVHLVFHHPRIAAIKSPLLQGDYKDRRMAYFKSMAEVKSAKNELERIMNEIISIIDKNS
jgi:hypothetical protein